MNYEELPAEFGEAKAHMELADYLRNQYEAAKAHQTRMLSSHLEAGQPFEATNALIFSPLQSSHARGQHDRLLYGPRKFEKPDHTTPKIAVRFPVTPGQDHWNDSFLQVWSHRGKSQDYLFNSKGLKPFIDARRDVQPDEDFKGTGDLFVVRYERLKMRRPTTIEGLNRVLQRYVWLPQSGEPL